MSLYNGAICCAICGVVTHDFKISCTSIKNKEFDKPNYICVNCSERQKYIYV